MKNLNKKIVVIVSLMLAVLLVGVSVFNVYKDTHKLQIVSKNTKDISVFDKSDSEKPKKVFSGDNKTVRLKKGDYVVKYTGDEGYGGGEVDVEIEDIGVKIEINPPYSQEKLDQILNSEKPKIQTVLSGIKGIDQYIVQKGSLYSYGEWYGTTLIYNGPDYYNADSLRAVLKKENEQWVLKTTFPGIILNTVDHPDIPEEILSAVNSQPAPIQEKYTATD